jgi:serine protease AprX
VAPGNGATMGFQEVEPGFRGNTEPPYLVEIDIQPGAAPFRVVLAYTDYPGYRAQNCLNLLVAPPRRRKPLMGNNPAGGIGIPDTRNNVEVVHVARPRPGRWRVQVSAVRIAHPPQPFALVYLADL